MKHNEQFKNGQKVDDYLLDHFLGGGQDGEVWQAKKVSLGNKCAIKFLNAIDDPDKLIRFQREISILSQVEHPHVISIRDRGTAWNPTSQQTVPYYVMEYISGLPLDKAIDHFPDEEKVPTLCALYLQVLSALEEVHRSGLSHGDIKSANILVQVEARIVKLSDFGFGLGANDQRSRKEYPESSHKVPKELSSLEADLYRVGKTLSHSISLLNVTYSSAELRSLRALALDLTNVPTSTTTQLAISRLIQIHTDSLASTAYHEELTAIVPELDWGSGGSAFLKDHVWGTFPLSHRLRTLIDTRASQNTRRIYAFPSVSLVYPTGQVSRFELMLGSYAALTHTIPLLLEDRKIRSSLTGDYLSTLFAAVLLKHISTGAMDVQLREAIPNFEGSGERTIRLMTSDPDVTSVVHEWGNDTYELLLLLFGKHNFARPTPLSVLEWLLNNPFAPSNIEWLTRVSMLVGWQLADFRPLWHGLAIHDERPGLVYRKQSIPALEELIRARFMAFDRVLRHHSVRAADLMVIRALRQLAPVIDFNSLRTSSDVEFLTTCASAARRHSMSEPLRLIEDYLSRRLFRRVSVISLESMSSTNKLAFDPIRELDQIEERFAQEIGVDKGEIMIDWPSRTRLHNDVYVLQGDQIHQIEKVSGVVEQIDLQWKRLEERIRIYSSFGAYSHLKDKGDALQEALVALVNDSK
jgi:serine/threonine protein kinase